jgi:intraflagellar transport protein 88
VAQFEVLNTQVTHDPGILARLGAIHARMDDEGKALHYYTESHRVYPVNMDVISWLGAFHVKSEVYEKAMPFFDLASDIQPGEVKWQLMVASCYRRVGAYNEALTKYGDIHASHPENVECLRYLVHIYTDLGRKDDVHDYVVKLRKAERAQGEAAATMAAAATRSGSGGGGAGVGEMGPGAGMGGMNGSGGGYGGGGQGGGGQGGGGGGGGMESSGGGMMPSSPPPSRGNTRQSTGGGDDEWGGGELGDDLLPGM